jgi:predicted transposase YbfD/YdcC
LAQTYEINRGRPEARSLWRMALTPVQAGFPHAAQVGELRRFLDRGVRQKDEVEREYLLSSLSPAALDAAAMLALDRNYWGIESGLHQRLDISAREDHSRVRTRSAAFNLSLFRRAAMSFVIHWIRRQPDKRRATTKGFYDEMRANNSRKAFSLVTCQHPTWLPRK